MTTLSSGRMYKADISSIDTLKSQIISEFKDIVDELENSKTELLNKLDELANQLVKEQEETDNFIHVLEEGVRYSSDKEGDSDFLKSISEQHAKDTEAKLKELHYHRTKNVIVYTWDDAVLEGLVKLGKVELRDKVRYHDKREPVIRAGKEGSRNGELNGPAGLSVDLKSNDIFVADSNNGRVQVFDSTGKYLFKFGEYGPGKMKRPYYITVHDDKVYVSLWERYVSIYDVKGNYISQFGNQGPSSAILSNPTGLAISDRNKCIYVCDASKDIISVYSQDFEHLSSFGKGTLHHPLQILLSQDRIYVLDKGDPCIHVFNSDHIYSHSIVSRGYGKSVETTDFFMLDIEDNILISDWGRHLISVFDNNGELIHEIGKEPNILQKPTGIAIDGMNRIISVDLMKDKPLKIF